MSCKIEIRSNTRTCCSLNNCNCRYECNWQISLRFLFFFWRYLKSHDLFTWTIHWIVHQFWNKENWFKIGSSMNLSPLLIDCIKIYERIMKIRKESERYLICAKESERVSEWMKKIWCITPLSSDQYVNKLSTYTRMKGEEEDRWKSLSCLFLHYIHVKCWMH